MNTITPPAAELITAHLTRITASPPPAAASARHDPAASQQQIRLADTLVLTYTPVLVADAYSRHLEASLNAQRSTAQPLRTWEGQPPATRVDGQPGDRYGFLCRSCSQNLWQLLALDNRLDRLCSDCVRRDLHRDPAAMWEPQLPAAHTHLAHAALAVMSHDVGYAIRSSNDSCTGLGGAAGDSIPCSVSL